jgi:hypothetical protein
MILVHLILKVATPRTAFSVVVKCAIRNDTDCVCCRFTLAFVLSRSVHKASMEVYSTVSC